jgi:HSP20 family protein
VKLCLIAGAVNPILSVPVCAFDVWSSKVRFHDKALFFNHLTYAHQPISSLAFDSLKNDRLLNLTSTTTIKEYMSLIRYQTPNSMMLPSLDRWANLRNDLDTLLELPFWSGLGRQSQLFSGWTPPLDLYQNNDNIVAVVELPGMRKEDIEISLQDGTLTISGERKEETVKDGAARSERFTGKFRRSVTLPTRVDANKVNATYKDGILTVTLPKAEEAKPKQIQINLS